MKKNPKKTVIVGRLDKGDMNKATPGTTRYLVFCDALHNGEPVLLERAWRTRTPEEAIANVTANTSGFHAFKNCTAQAIPGSLKK